MLNVDDEDSFKFVFLVCGSSRIGDELRLKGAEIKKPCDNPF